ncbi:hypothetical protein FF2_045821 [Malus domestica]
MPPKCQRKSEANHCLAFGFQPLLNDYKVVRMMSFRKDKSINVEVYSLSTESWKSVGANPGRINGLDTFSVSAMFNGVAYWVLGDGYACTTYYLLSFSTGIELFRKLKPPKAMTSDGNQPRNVAQYKESICLLQHIVSERSHLQVGRAMCSLFASKNKFRTSSYKNRRLCRTI